MLCNERRNSRLPDFGFGHTAAAERWINKQSISQDPIREPPAILGKKIGSNNLIVVVGSMGKPAVSVAVSQRPYAWHAGSKLIVDIDIAPLIHRNSGFVQTKVLCIGHPSNRQEKVTTQDFFRLFL